MTKTICVGNLSLGGTGKTPMVEYLVRLFSKQYQLSILSRGYRRKTKGFVLANSHSKMEELGDEPYQYHQKFKNVQIAVDGDRIRGCAKLSKHGTQLILLDDAYQHRPLNAHLNILLTSYHKPYHRDWLFPIGTLRDLRNRAATVEMVIVTKCPSDIEETEMRRIEKELKLKPHQQLFFSKIDYSDRLYKGEESVPIAILQEQQFTLVTGIANPNPLIEYLSNRGLSFHQQIFRDHHYFSDKEIEEFSKSPLVLTTEKDYRRISNPPDNLYYLPIEMSFVKDQDKFDRLMNDFMF